MSTLQITDRKWSNGNPLRFVLTGGQCHDITQAETLVAGYEFEYLLADRGYDATSFLSLILAQGAVPVMPPRRNRKQKREYDKHIYQERHLVECLIGKIKHYRRVFSRTEVRMKTVVFTRPVPEKTVVFKLNAVRFDKLAGRYPGCLSFVGALIWLR